MDLYGQIANIPTPPDKVDHAAQTAIDETDGIFSACCRAYKYGHRDARHAACDIANEADRRIRELRAENADLKDNATTLRVRIRELENALALAEWQFEEAGG